MQAHQEGNRALVEEVIASTKGALKILELYSGSGNLSVPLALANSDRTLTCIEYDPDATRSLQELADTHHLKIKTLTHSINQLPDGLFDHIVLDPPRAGAKHLIPSLSKASVNAITYVSCHPAALARDITGLVEGGWHVNSARIFHLFPHTGHAEVCVKLTRHQSIA